MSGYIGNIPVPQATQTRESFTATASQTTFNTAGYTPNFLDVFLNGVHLLNGTDYTATNGSDVVLTTGAAASDVVEVISYSTYEVNAQTYTGGLTVNNDGATVLTIDRATSDGSIVDFKKDGTTVGSIGTVASAAYISSNDTGLQIYGAGATDQIVPSNGSGATRDNAIDLGKPTGRFKDLYLSGGAYLGGTGAANYLDDYEEGTFTPYFASGSCTYNYQIGRYTKVGRTVSVYIYLDWTGGSSLHNNIYGAPFAASTGQYYPMGSVFNNAGVSYPSGRSTLITYINDNSSIFTVTTVGSGVSAAGNTYASAGYVHISLVYDAA